MPFFVKCHSFAFMREGGGREGKKTGRKEGERERERKSVFVYVCERWGERERESKI